MTTKALYIGFRTVDYKEHTNEKGDKLPAYKGTSYTFFQNKWVKGELKENGMFLNMMVKDGEPKPDITVGQKYEITITDINNRRCKLYEDEDEEEDD